MPLPALDPFLDAVNEWARAHSLPIHDGTIELGDALPQIDVIALDLDDVEIFLTLATALERPVLVMNQVALTSEGLGILRAVVDDIKKADERRFYTDLLGSAQGHLDGLQRLEVYAFAPDLTRVVVFRATADWAAPLFSLADDLLGD